MMVRERLTGLSRRRARRGSSISGGRSSRITPARNSTSSTAPRSRTSAPSASPSTSSSPPSTWRANRDADHDEARGIGTRNAQPDEPRRGGGRGRGAGVEGFHGNGNRRGFRRRTRGRRDGGRRRAVGRIARRGRRRAKPTKRPKTAPRRSAGQEKRGPDYKAFTTKFDEVVTRRNSASPRSWSACAPISTSSCRTCPASWRGSPTACSGA